MSDEEEKRPPLSRSEKVKNYLIGIGALTGLILGLFSTFKGEPIAEQTWETLRTKVNEQAKALNRLSRRVVFLQAHEEGRTAAALQLKLEALEKKLEASPLVKTKSAPVKKKIVCGVGYILGSDGKCEKVPKGVSLQVKKVTTAYSEALKEERMKRVVAEKRKNALDRLLQVYKTQQQTQKDPDIKLLPKKLK